MKTDKDQLIEKACSKYVQDKDSYAIYLRKSRADLELEAMGEGETLARHKKMLEALAAKHDIHSDQITEYREVVSGDSISERPQMQKLLHDVYTKKYKGVLVVEVERLARGNTKDQGEVADAFQYSNTLIITPAKVYDPQNEFDQEYFEFGLFMSRREYKTIRRRLEAGKLQSVMEGNYIGSTAPYGFDIERRSKKDIVLVEKPEESELVKMIFDLWVNERISAGRIAAKLTKMQVKTPRGKKDWNRSAIIDILQNPHYIGKIRWKNREVKKEFVDGQLKKTNRRSNPETTQIFEGKHEGFISEELFNKAQALFDQTAHNKICTTITNPLAGILHCADCGKAIRFNCTTTTAAQSRYIHLTTVDCKKKSLPSEQIIAAVINTLELSIQDFEFKMNSQDEQREKVNHAAMIERMEAELYKLEKKRSKLFDDYEDDIYTREEFIERKQKYNNDIETLKKQIQETKSDVPEPVDYETKIANVQAAIDWLKDTELNGKEKNDFLKTVIKDITYDVIDHGVNKGGAPILAVSLK